VGPGGQLQQGLLHSRRPCRGGYDLMMHCDYTVLRLSPNPRVWPYEGRFRILINKADHDQGTRDVRRFQFEYSSLDISRRLS